MSALHYNGGFAHFASYRVPSVMKVGRAGHGRNGIADHVRDEFARWLADRMIAYHGRQRPITNNGGFRYTVAPIALRSRRLDETRKSADGC